MLALKYVSLVICLSFFAPVTTGFFANAQDNSCEVVPADDNYLNSLNQTYRGVNLLLDYVKVVYNEAKTKTKGILTSDECTKAGLGISVAEAGILWAEASMRLAVIDDNTFSENEAREIMNVLQEVGCNIALVCGIVGKSAVGNGTAGPANEADDTSLLLLSFCVALTGFVIACLVIAHYKKRGHH
jgi:uncharacterized membrane protein YeaQ/YmgE (transglycosylase-associated protein family)